jgi:transcriptional regulator with XRE-family HTH domain
MKFFKDIRKYFNLTREQLALLLSIDTNTITAYENGRSYPSFKVLVKTAGVFSFSLDYMLGEQCLYPQDLKLIRLAKELDQKSFSDSRKNIKITAKSLFGNKPLPTAVIRQDSIDIELSNDFHSNLKNIRNFRNMTQADLAEKLEITRTLLSQYELRIYPTVNKLAEFSRLLGVSIQALATGEKLIFEFQDKNFGETILLADHFLPLEDHQILIRLMEAALNNH